ncbi:MAG: radical SAM protein, partial [Desulfomonilaceae bacterium]
MNDRADLAGMTLEETQSFIERLGQPKYRAAQIMRWIHQGLCVSFEPMTNLSKDLRQNLAESSLIGRLSTLQTVESEDGVKKFLLGLGDGTKIESVYIPSEDHDTLCVSTQVGCAMGCRICRTSQMGLTRNLTAGEIVGQLLEVRRQIPGSAITNVVLMGMGEPLANFDNTVRAIKIFSNSNGPQISWRRITVSTSGLAPLI